ncbi:MAG: hypothetical protein ACLR8P_05495 [Clostridium fessum]
MRLPDSVVRRRAAVATSEQASDPLTFSSMFVEMDRFRSSMKAIINVMAASSVPRGSFSTTGDSAAGHDLAPKGGDGRSRPVGVTQRSRGASRRPYEGLTAGREMWILHRIAQADRCDLHGADLENPDE